MKNQIQPARRGASFRFGHMLELSSAKLNTNMIILVVFSILRSLLHLASPSMADQIWAIAGMRKLLQAIYSWACVRVCVCVFLCVCVLLTTSFQSAWSGNGHWFNIWTRVSSWSEYRLIYPPSSAKLEVRKIVYCRSGKRLNSASEALRRLQRAGGKSRKPTFASLHYHFFLLFQPSLFIHLFQVYNADCVILRKLFHFYFGILVSCTRICIHIPHDIYIP